MTLHTARVLLDKLNGTPCAEVRWQQELDDARNRWDAALHPTAAQENSRE